MEGDLRVVWKVRDRGSGLGGVEGDGGGRVREDVGGQNNGLRRVWGWNLARVGAGERHRGGTRVQARKVRVGAKTRGVGLKQGQRRDVRMQRRDVPESG